jgi:hypothetical protein
MRIALRFGQMAVLVVLSSVALAPQPARAAVNDCGASQTECEDCCNDAFLCCVETGGTPTGECDWQPGNPNYCNEPGCFGGGTCPI